MIVLCAGAASGRLHPGLASCLVAVPGQGLTMSGKDGGGARLSLSANFGHVRLAWIGSGAQAERTLRAWAIPWSLRRPEDLDVPAAIDPALQQRLEQYIRAHLPVAAALPVTVRGAARMAYTQDNLPLVGPLPGQPRVACCAGFSGHDWSLALAAAELLAAALAGEPRDPVLEILSPRRLMVS
jgi:glycine/D-amino acid oxidase-like deaminating enzyme